MRIGLSNGLSVFTYRADQIKSEPESQDCLKGNLCNYFTVSGFPVQNKNEQKPIKVFKLDEQCLSAALEFLFR